VTRYGVKKRRPTPLRWASVDWTRPLGEIAAELGVSYNTTVIHRRQAGHTHATVKRLRAELAEPGRNTL
jgi:hypothetical protein